MTDHEIHACIDDKNQQMITNVENIIGSFSQSLTMLITSENQTIKHSIDELTKRVEKQNGSVRTLNEWKAKHEGIETGIGKTNTERRAETQKTLQLIGTVIIAIGLCFTAYFGVKNSKVAAQLEETKDEINTKIEQVDRVSKVTRGGYVKYNDQGMSDSIKLY